MTGTAMLLVLLDWKIIYKTILEKVFYLYCGLSFFFLVFALKKFGKWPF
jgi:hypothetical protein